ncbi:MAG: Arm DNA-binding domain-containing protein [Solirubrobacteraceae bacterium]
MAIFRDPETGSRRQKWHSGYKRRRDAEVALGELLTRLDGGSHIEPSKILL